MARTEEPTSAARGLEMKAVADGLAARVPRMCAETEALLARELPELVERTSPVLRARVVEATFRRVIAERGGPPAVADQGTHVEFGAAAARAGIGLEALNAGYRVGARVGWAHTKALLAELGADAALALELADSHVAFVDALARESQDGHAAARRRARDVLAERSEALVADLLAGDPAAQAAFGEEVAVAVLLEPPPPELPAGTLTGRFEGTPVLVGPPAALATAGVACAVGPGGPASDAPRSLLAARDLAALADAGRLALRGPTRWEDHLPLVLAHADPTAARALAVRRLGPLAAAAPAHARLLRETLDAWLDHPGQPAAIGRRLHLHPQTIRYRVTRLREAFGEALDDPAARLELRLALLADEGGGAGMAG